MVIRRLSVHDWHLIDATMDNTAATAIFDRQGTEAAEVARLARSVRERGWHASLTHARAGQGGLGWPPLDAELTIDLEPATWSFVREQIERWADVSRELVDAGLDQAARDRQVRSVQHSEAVLELLAQSPSSRSGPRP